MDNKDNKKYYWIKLKTDFFNRDEIDFLLGQKKGCEYIVLYQMLCLNTANNDGKLQTKVGEMIIPYDIDKIVREAKYFDRDTVVVALELFKKLGLVYEEDNKVLTILDFDTMVGSESKYAEKMRKYREKKQKEISYNVADNVSDKVNYNVRQEIDYRDKSIESRDIEKENIPLQQQQQNNNIYETIESNFGRPLSPMEYEKINLWDKEFGEDILLHAVKLSVMSNKRVFSYVNGILRNWKSKGYKTLQEIKDNEDQPSERPIREIDPEKKKLLDELYDYDWLNDSDKEEDY